MGSDKDNSFIHHLPMGYARHKILCSTTGEPTDYVFLDVNPAYETMTGLRADQVIGKKESDIFPKESSIDFNWVHVFGEVALTGKDTTFTQYSLALERWLRMTVYSPCHGEFITLFQDISEEKRKDEALREALQFNREIIKHANNGIIVYDRDLRYKVFNPYMEKQTGRAAVDVINRHPWQLFPESLENGVMEYLHGALEGISKSDVELSFVNAKTGDAIWSLQTFSPMKNDEGTITGVIVTIQDITDKKRVMRERDKLNDFMQLTLDQLPIGVALNDTDTGKAIYMNNQFESTYGWPKEKLTGVDNFFEHVYKDPAYRQKMKHRILEDMASGDAKNMRWEGVVITTQKGETRYVNAANIPIPEQSLMVSTVWDTTHIITHEHELRQEKEKAEAANIAKSQFLANMSHEIRTPMNGFMGMIQLLETTNLDEEQQELLALTKRSSDVLLNVLNDILDFSRIEANKIQLQSKVFNLKVLIADVLGLFKGAAMEKNISLIHCIDPDIPEILVGDGFRLRQVISNLVGNGIKFTKEGQVVLRAECQPCVDQGRTKLFVSVEDTGIGIEEKHLEHIFERFIQSDSSNTRSYGGTGLGLAISKGLVELMGGNMTVESQVGKGSRFSFSCVLEKPWGPGDMP